MIVYTSLCVKLAIHVTTRTVPASMSVGFASSSYTSPHASPVPSAAFDPQYGTVLFVEYLNSKPLAVDKEDDNVITEL